MNDWIVVPNWERFQHYGLARAPIWIKNYTTLLRKDEYLEQTLSARGLLHGIWLAYAERKGQLRADRLRDILQTRGRLDHDLQHIASLNHAGLIGIVDSKPLLLNLSNPLHARTRAEALEQELSKSSLPVDERALQQLRHQALDVAADWTGGPSEKFDATLDDLERELHARLPEIERQKLWDEALKRSRRK